MEWLETVLWSPTGMKFVLFLLTGGGLGYVVHLLLKNNRGYLWDVVRRALFEVGSAVYEVYQTYTSERLKLSADGVLTEAEKKVAFDLAMTKAKSNLGPKGLKRLMKVLDLSSPGLESWLGTQVEAKVVELKAGPLAP